MLKINQAFVDSFTKANFGLPIAHENIDYKPTAGTPYAEILVIENDVTPLDLSYTDETDGVFRVILRYPSGGGAVAARTMSDRITAFYNIGKVIEYDAQRVIIRKFGGAPGESRDGWYVFIVNIYYKAYARRI